MVPHMVFHEPAPTYFPGPDVWGTGRAVPTSGITREFGTYYAPVNERVGAEAADVLISDDHNHPNQAGHAKIAEAFAGAVLATDRFLK